MNRSGQRHGARNALLGVVVATGMLLGACARGDTEVGVEAFCERFAPLADLGDQLTGENADLQRLASEVNALAEVSPAAVRPAVERIAGALDTMASAAEASGEVGPAAVAAGFAAIEGELAQLEDASATVENYSRTECGLDPGPAND